MTPAPNRSARLRKNQKQRKPGHELIGSNVYIPSSVFHKSFGPSYIHGVVKGHDSVHRGHMIVKCSDDSRRFFFPLDSIRSWSLPPEDQARHHHHRDSADDSGTVEGHASEDGDLESGVMDEDRFSFEPEPEPKPERELATAGEDLGRASGSVEASRGGQDTADTLGSARLSEQAAAVAPPDSPLPRPASTGRRSKRRSSSGSHAPRRRAKRSSTSKGEVRDLLGKLVDVPCWVFNMDVPEMYYPGRVLGPDSAHGNSVVVKLKDDPTRYYFPAPDVRQWLLRTEASLAEQGPGQQHRRTTGSGSDMFAAEVLMDLSQSGHKRMRERQSPATSASAGSPGRSGEEVEGRGCGGERDEEGFRSLHMMAAVAAGSAGDAGDAQGGEGAERAKRARASGGGRFEAEAEAGAEAHGGGSDGDGGQASEGQGSGRQAGCAGTPPGPVDASSQPVVVVQPLPLAQLPLSCHPAAAQPPLSCQEPPPINPVGVPLWLPGLPGLVLSVDGAVGQTACAWAPGTQPGEVASSISAVPGPRPGLELEGKGGNLWGESLGSGAGPSVEDGPVLAEMAGGQGEGKAGSCGPARGTCSAAPVPQYDQRQQRQQTGKLAGESLRGGSSSPPLPQRSREPERPQGAPQRPSPSAPPQPPPAAADGAGQAALARQATRSTPPYTAVNPEALPQPPATRPDQLHAAAAAEPRVAAKKALVLGLPRLTAASAPAMASFPVALAWLQQQVTTQVNTGSGGPSPAASSAALGGGRQPAAAERGSCACVEQQQQQQWVNALTQQQQQQQQQCAERAPGAGPLLSLDPAAARVLALGPQPWAHSQAVAGPHTLPGAAGGGSRPTVTTAIVVPPPRAALWTLYL